MSHPSAGSVEIVERYRPFLRGLVRVHADERFNGKVDLSGVVQQTVLDAHAISGQWHEWTEDRRVAWLRRVLANNLTDEIRRVTAQVRDIAREGSIEQRVAGSSARIEAFLAAEQSSPSARAARNEDLLRLFAALDALPEDQRRAVELHHLMGRSITDTAAALDKTAQAVVGLLFRGLRRLRELMA